MVVSSVRPPHTTHTTHHTTPPHSMALESRGDPFLTQRLQLIAVVTLLVDLRERGVARLHQREQRWYVKLTLLWSPDTPA